MTNQIAFERLLYTTSHSFHVKKKKVTCTYICVGVTYTHTKTLQWTEIHLKLKRYRKQSCKLAWKSRKMYKYFNLKTLYDCSFNIYAIEVCLFLLWIWTPKVGSHFGLLFTNEEQKKVGSWHNKHSCHACRPYSWHHRLPVTKWQHACSCFHEFQTSNFNKINLWHTRI